MKVKTLLIWVLLCCSAIADTETEEEKLGTYQLGNLAIVLGPVQHRDDLPSSFGNVEPTHTFVLLPVGIGNAGNVAEGIPRFSLLLRGTQYDRESPVLLPEKVRGHFYDTFELIEPGAKKQKVLIFDAPKAEQYELLASAGVLSRIEKRMMVYIPGASPKERQERIEQAKARLEAERLKAEKEAELARTREKAAAEVREKEFRTWVSGTYSVEARFASYANGKVTLEKRDGEKFTVELRVLSESDQEFVHSKMDALRKR